MSVGYLSITARLAGESVPIEGVKVYIASHTTTGISDLSPVSSTYYNYYLTTGSSGNTGFIRIETPDSATGNNPESTTVPYSLVDVYAEKSGYFPVRINNVQVFGGISSVLPINMTPLSEGFTDATAGVITYNIPPNGLLLPKVSEPEGPSGLQTEALIAEDIYIPETITVHLGSPSSNAENINVPFVDYIKNVSSSEIYPTWPEEALRANIIAIITLTLNRFFTEWYPSQGYDFDITSSTAYDQSYVLGRNVFENISRITDDLFNTYMTREGLENPFYAAFCDGREVQCDGLSQWGTVELAERGLNSLQILKNYYGDDIRLVTTDNIDGVQSSYPGTPLSLGSVGDDVLIIQQQLMRIRENYPAIPLIPTIEGVFGNSTDQAVRKFQEIFDLDVDGIVGKSTWYRISYIYSSVAKLAELSGEGISDVFSEDVPDITISAGDTGNYVLLLQLLLDYIGIFYPTVSSLTEDGIFGTATEKAVREFQRTFGLSETGIVTPAVWDAIYRVYIDIITTVTPSLPNQGYPGRDLRRGDISDSVRLIQRYLNSLTSLYPQIPRVSEDGVFGGDTESAVLAFQRAVGLNPTGVINVSTWERIAELYNFQNSR